jgi:hypothetical protein
MRNVLRGPRLMIQRPQENWDELREKNRAEIEHKIGLQLRGAGARLEG